MTRLLLILMGSILLFPEQAWAASCSATLVDDTIDDLATCEGDIAVETIISSTLCIVRALLAQAMFEIFCVLSEAMEPVIAGALVLYVLFYTIAIVFGINDPTTNRPVTGKGFTVRALKVLTIYILATNAEIFYKFMYEMIMFGLLDGLSEILMELDTEEIADDDPDDPEAGVFAFVDELFAALLGTEKIVAFAVIVTALMLTGIGAPIALLLVSAFISLLWAIVRILIVYATAILALTFLLMWTPLFVATAMFSYTRRLFDNWVASIISYTLQPVIVLAFLFLIAGATDINEDLADLQYNSDGEEIFSVDTKTILNFEWGKIHEEIPRFKDLTGVGEDPTDFKEFFLKIAFHALTFLILNVVMAAFLAKVPTLAQSLAQYRNYIGAPVIAGSPEVGRFKTMEGLISPSAQRGAQGVLTATKNLNPFARRPIR